MGLATGLDGLAEVCISSSSPGSSAARPRLGLGLVLLATGLVGLDRVGCLQSQ